MIEACGVTVLDGRSEVAAVRGQRLRLSGATDPTGFYAASAEPAQRLTERFGEQLARLAGEGKEGIYHILLSHRPERAADYARHGFDLAVCGHAHGGQVRIPLLLNGLYAPDQGWFPGYAGGRYELGDGAMIVSRGLAKNGLPRVFNRPELVVIDLLPGEK